MNLRFSKEERDVIQRIHVLSGEPVESVRKIIESLCMSILISSMEDEDIYIPLLGRVSVVYKGDVITRDGREADISVEVEPSKSLKRLVGQIEDGQESDLEVELKKEISKILKSLVS